MIIRLQRFQELSGLLSHCIWCQVLFLQSGSLKCHSVTPNLESPQSLWMSDLVVLKLWLFFFPVPVHWLSSLGFLSCSLSANPTQCYPSAPIPQLSSPRKISILWEGKPTSNTGRNTNMRSGRLANIVQMVLFGTSWVSGLY